MLRLRGLIAFVAVGLLLGLVSFPQLVHAQTITEIKITGNKKIEGDAIRARLVSKVGERFSQEKVHQDVLQIYGMGYFYNIEVDKTGSVLTYRITEKPSVVEITFDGNSEISDDDLREAAGLKAYEILDVAEIQTAIEKMRKQYEEKGYFLANIDYNLKPMGGNQDGVRLKFHIQENDKVKVKKITILGNENVPDSELTSKMVTQEEGFFSFLSGSGQYKQDGFDRDVQVIRLIYYNKGYVQVKVSRPQVYISPDKKNIYITIRVEEGQQYNVGRVDFGGDLLFSEDVLFGATEIEESDIFAYDILQKDLRELQALYGDLGYAYANIIPRTQIREDDKLVDLTFEIDKGNKVYFGRFNVVGNTKTRDKVVRRELRIKEGELYNETRKRESIANVKRLGYFDEVAFNQKSSGDDNDVMDIDIRVKERNTGSIQVGAGYGSYSGFIFNGRVQQSNLFGKGQRLGLTIQTSQNEENYILNFTEPYFYDTEWSTGVDAYHTITTVGNTYRERKTGGALRLGHPLAPYLRAFVRYKNDSTDIQPRDLFDDSIFDETTAEGRTSSVTLTLEYDKRNDRWAPTEGAFVSTSIEYAGVGGDQRYTEGYFNARYFQEIFWDLVWRNNFTYSFITAPDGNEPPFNELYRLGGANSLRGFEWFSIGRTATSLKDPNNPKEVVVGGKQQAYYNMEFQFPLIQEAGILGVTFFDIGYANDELILDQFRSDVGFGVRWFSPIGPLRFEWGFPLDRKPGEDSVQFQFSIGSPF